VYVEWLEKAASQNNPEAMEELGEWFRYVGGDKNKAVSYYLAAAQLGWKSSMRDFAEMLRDGEGCEKDLRQAVMWSAKGDFSFGMYWEMLKERWRADGRKSWIVI
jgi:TPR repeat protein